MSPVPDLQPRRQQRRKRIRLVTHAFTLVLLFCWLMGSTQAPGDIGAFGYEIDPSAPDFENYEHPSYDPPYDNAPGVTFTDNDHQILDGFFSIFNNGTAGEHSLADQSLGEGLNDTWWSMIPMGEHAPAPAPALLGHNTWGPEPANVQAPQLNYTGPSLYGDYMEPPSMIMPPPPQDEEVRNAASALLGAPAVGNRPEQSEYGLHTFPRTPGATVYMAPPVPQPRPSHQQTYNGFAMREPPPDDDHHNDHFTTMMWGHQGAYRPPPRTTPPVGMQFGSDTNFNKSSYTPLSDKDSSEALTKRQMSYMNCITLNKSAENTRASSPVFTGDPPPPAALKGKARPSVSVPEELGDNLPSPQAKRRRKSKATLSDTVEGVKFEPSPTPTAKILGSGGGARKKKQALVSPVLPEPQGKRRKSSGNAPSKHPRENLTEKQKRENHIKSEQKRRTLIKDGFDSLQKYIPTLQIGGFSKSVMLNNTSDYLENLLQANADLELKLG
ncbi:hypothetical protein B0H63DRAFT_469562 [Podospora didyma]|uniref:BHLH domain-containing protein n=1 Tax=Podospora didyma TaxID=330526 RepID=A0AAE0NT60_9PEZI|nr:hypothetical protein B0H63DRAFT_469562 [Podospora didyma]